MIIEMSDRMLSQNIRYLRKKHKLSQTGLAKLARISVTNLREIENSSAPPRVTADTLHRICAALSAAVEDLIHKDLTAEAASTASNATVELPTQRCEDCLSGS